MRRLVHCLILAAVLAVPFTLLSVPSHAADLTEIKIALRPGKLASFDAVKHLPFLEYMEKQLDRPVKLRLGKDYDSVVSELRSGQVHAAFLGPFSYVLAQEVSGNAVEPLVVAERKDAHHRAYNSIIVASGTSKVLSPSQFNRNHLFSVPDPASTSGYLVPFHKLTELGLDPETHFKSVHIAGSHAGALLRVQNGQADGAASNTLTYNDLHNAGLIDINRVRIIWRSPDLPEGPIAVRKDLDGEIKYRLLKAFITMPPNLGIFDYDGELEGFKPAYDRHYDVIRDVRARMSRPKG